MRMSAPLHTLTLAELAGLFKGVGLNAHQARLTFRALHRYGLRDPEKMSELSGACREYLMSLPPLPTLTADEVHRAADGTIKLSVKLHSGESIESVIIPAGKRVTLCVSSQAGCAAACSFCHTGTMGLLRNLQPWEIVEQVRVAEEVLADNPKSKIENPKLTNIVFMGMGEPLHNEAAVVQACRIFNDDNGLGFSRRHIVMSTAGVGNRLRPFWEEGVASLAVSLHATTDAVRDQIVPLNKSWNLAALKKILYEIPWRTRESLTVAYLLLDGVNDSFEDAQRLRDWIDGLPAKVNLLEFNPFPGTAFKRCSPEKLAQFRQWLYELGVFNTLRHSRGEDVMAACGQLATARTRKRIR
jgi:23S rRNA (adenine2503-C2)-methyltransferase